MSAQSEGHIPGEFEPDIDRARRTATLAHHIVTKFQEMELPQEMNDALADLGTDLGDLWSAQKSLEKHLENLLHSPHDWESVADALVDIRACIDHMAWHMKSIRRPMSRITQYAYRRASEPRL
ncbi:MAG: hypothetical protein L0177_05615 [Chloroflexi bacterium]|nr:hypothetical protein [Chloroflexota bacterium]